MSCQLMILDSLMFIIRKHRDTIRLLIHEALLIKFKDPNLNRKMH